MIGLALFSFISVFAFGQDIFGWQDTSGHVQMALGLTFVLGVVCGYRTRTSG